MSIIKNMSWIYENNTYFPSMKTTKEIQCSEIYRVMPDELYGFNLKQVSINDTSVATCIFKNEYNKVIKKITDHLLGNENRNLLNVSKINGLFLNGEKYVLDGLITSIIKDVTHIKPIIIVASNLNDWFAADSTMNLIDKNYNILVYIENIDEDIKVNPDLVNDLIDNTKVNNVFYLLPLNSKPAVKKSSFDTVTFTLFDKQTSTSSKVKLINNVIDIFNEQNVNIKHITEDNDISKINTVKDLLLFLSECN